MFNEKLSKFQKVKKNNIFRFTKEKSETHTSYIKEEISKDKNKYKNKSLKKLFNVNLIIIFMNVIILIFTPISTSKKIVIRLLNNNNYIMITIQGKGLQTLINENYISSLSSIKINEEEEITENISNIQNLNFDLNVIQLKFNSQLNSCNEIFRNLLNITQIDLTYFDFSLVKYMGSSFEGCNSVK